MAVSLFVDFSLDLADEDHELVNFEDFWLWPWGTINHLITASPPHEGSISEASRTEGDDQRIMTSWRHAFIKLLVRHFVNVIRAHQRALWHWTSSSSFAFSRAAQVFANISSVYLFLTMRPLFLQSVMFSCRFLQKQKALLLASRPAAADSIFSRTKRDGNSETLPTRKLGLLCSISGDVFKIRNTKEPELDTQTQILSYLVMT